MRAYLDGTLSKEQEIFLPQDLWFSTEECYDNTIVSEDCITYNKKRIFIGRYKTKQEAVKARIQKELELFKEFSPQSGG